MVHADGTVTVDPLEVIALRLSAEDLSSMLLESLKLLLKARTTLQPPPIHSGKAVFVFFFLISGRW